MPRRLALHAPHTCRYEGSGSVMRATVNRKALAAALKSVTPALSRGGSLPILAGVRIEATSAGLDLCCSNLDLTATALVPDTEDVTDGVAIPPAQLFSRIIDKLGGENVRLSLEDNVLTITSGETVATVRTWLPEEWPKIEAVEGATVSWTAGDVAMIERLVPFAATDTARPGLCAIALVGTEAAATDSYHLGVVHELPEVGEALIPVEAMRLALSGGDPVDVAIGERMVTFTAGTRTISTQLIAESFPKYGGLIPPSPPHHLTFARHELEAAVDRAELASIEDKSAKNSRHVRIERDGDKARVWAVDGERGSDVSDTIGCRGDFDLAVAFNPDFLGDLLAAVDTDDEVTLELVDNMKPATVHSGRLTLLVMPVRIA
jgi:DNA polymerase-3 subunit beta